MQPSGATQHTSRATTRLCCIRGLTARPLEGTGHGAIPLKRPHPAWAGRRSRLRRDVHPCRSVHAGFAGANRRRPQLPSEGRMFHGTASPTEHSTGRALVACPKPRISCLIDEPRGTPSTACIAARRSGRRGRPVQGRRRFAPPAVGPSRPGHPSMPSYRGQRDPCSRQSFLEDLG